MHYFKTIFVYVMLILVSYNSFSQTKVERLEFNTQTLIVNGIIEDTTYKSRSFYYGIAPEAGTVIFECQNKFVSLYSGSGIKGNQILFMKDWFEKNDTIFIMANNMSFEKNAFTTRIAGNTRSQAIETEIPSNILPERWFYYLPEVSDSLVLFNLEQSLDNAISYSTHRDSTILELKNFALLSFQYSDTVYFRTTFKTSLNTMPYSANCNSPLNPFIAVSGHNTLDVDYCINSYFSTQYFAESDTSIRFIRPNASNKVYMYLNKVYLKDINANDIIPVHKNDTLLFIWYNDGNIINDGFDIQQTSNAIGNYYDNPIIVEDSADSVVLDFSTSEYLYVSSQGLVMHTNNISVNLLAYAKKIYADSDQQAWLCRNSRNVKTFQAPLGTKATLYIKQIPNDTIIETNSNLFDDTTMFSIKQFTTTRQSDMHKLISDGELENIIVNGYDHSILSRNGEGRDLFIQRNTIWINTCGKAFTWTVDFKERYPGEYYYSPDAIDGPGCYTFNLYQDSLADTRYNLFYALRYKTHSRCSLEFKMNSDFRWKEGGQYSSPDPDKLFEIGEYSILLSGYSLDTTILCKIIEHPLEYIIPDSMFVDGKFIVATDTITITPDQSPILLDSLRNYYVKYSTAKPGTFHFTLEGANGEPFSGTINSSYKDSYWKQCKTSDESWLRIKNLAFQEIKLTTEFFPVKPGDFEELPVEAQLGENIGNTETVLYNRMYYSYTAPEDALYYRYSDNDNVSFYPHGNFYQIELKKGESFPFTVYSDSEENGFSFMLEKANRADTVFWDIKNGSQYIPFANSYLAKHFIALRYTAKEDGDFSIFNQQEGGTIYNTNWELISHYGYNHRKSISPIAIKKDSTYIIVPNNLFIEEYVTAYFATGDLGTTENPITAHLGINEPKTENGLVVHISGYIYYTYTAEKDGYLHAFGRWLKREDMPDQFQYTFKCKKDSTYRFKSYSGKFQWFLAYSENEAYLVPDSLKLSAKNYTSANSESEFLGFFIAPESGYLNADVNAEKHLRYVLMAGGYVNNNTVYMAKGEFTPVFVDNYYNAKDTALVSLKFLLDESLENELHAALNASDSIIPEFESITFTALSRMSIKYEWDFNGDGTVDSYLKEPLYTYTQPGKYEVRLIIGNCTYSDTLYQTITITQNCEKHRFELGENESLAYGEELSLNATPGAIWSTGDEGTVLYVQNFAEKDTTEIIWAVYEWGSECYMSDSIQISMLAREQEALVSENEIENSIFVYPTLFREGVSIKLEDGKSYSIALYSKQGICVFEKNNILATQDINLAFLPSGNYIMRVVNKETVQIFRLIKF